MRRSSVAIASVGAIMLVLGSIVAGCGSGSDDSATLQEAQWVATEIAGVDSVLPAEEGQATAVFSDGTITGSATINRFSGTYETGSDNSMTIQTLASTMMAGSEAAMAQETAYLAALEQATTYKVTAASLELLDADGNLLVTYEGVEPVSLTDTEWQATAYNNGQGGLQSLAADSTITALFGDDGTLSGNASINQYNTTYTVEEDGLMTIAAEIVSTQMAGSEELMTQEGAYLTALPQTVTYTIDGSELWLRDANGAALAHYTAQ